jgi:hypothetical protein
MLFTSNKDKGRAGMALAIAYFGSNGYTVNLPLNDTQWYDFVVEKDGIFQTVQCKATGNADKTIYLRSIGGSAGKVYDNVLNHPVDLLFCLDSDQNMFVIPVSKIREAGNTNSITLSVHHRVQGLNTAEYLVSI